MVFGVCRLTGCLGTSVLACGLWGFCKLSWYWAVTAEVFSLNNLFVALLLLLACHYDSLTDTEKLVKVNGSKGDVPNTIYRVVINFP